MRGPMVYARFKIVKRFDKLYDARMGAKDLVNRNLRARHLYMRLGNFLGDKVTLVAQPLYFRDAGISVVLNRCLL